MYTELSSIGEAEGKTVLSMTRSLLSGQMVIAFTDRTFLSLGVEHGYDDDDGVALQEFGFMDFGAQHLIASGIVGEAERGQKVAEYYAECHRRSEAAERRRYELLKAKFEGGER